MADGTDGADAFSGLVAYARAWGVKLKMASAASAASLRCLSTDQTDADRMSAIMKGKYDG